MENSIFEGAKFGDKFIIKNGKIGIYTRKSNLDGLHWIAIEDTSFTWGYNDNGQLANQINANYDIVSRYQEPIDEEKLDELAESKCWEYDDGEVTDISYRDFILGYKNGYRKAING